MKKTAQLKNLVFAKEILVMPGIYDGVSAVIAEKLGFKALCLGGYAASASLLGKPDISLLTLTEMTNHLRNITEVTDIPVLADGDTGYGSILNVIRTVREFEKAGAGGLFIEDQVFPKRCGHMEGKQVIPAEDMVSKIKAALDTRIDEDMIIMARTDAYAVYGLDEAIRRANLYHEAGADMIFIEAPTTSDEMKRLNQAVSAPSLANMVEGGKTPLRTAKELEDMGYSVAVFPVSAIYAAAKSVWNLLKLLSETGTTQGYEESMFCFDEFNELVNLRQYRKIESGYAAP
ncbi:MAG: carboxyvinyl-carboxyphosphonate phosphorylmutase [Desulfobacteraceae bacterium IS3]|nr:MAG: carboxyvinyl-carboxyphosphonate phosphorylmutase [Desulfobacteraceae bacterium IS3]